MIGHLQARFVARLNAYSGALVLVFASNVIFSSPKSFASSFPELAIAIDIEPTSSGSIPVPLKTWGKLIQTPALAAKLTKGHWVTCGFRWSGDYFWAELKRLSKGVSFDATFIDNSGSSSSFSIATFDSFSDVNFATRYSTQKQGATGAVTFLAQPFVPDTPSNQFPFDLPEVVLRERGTVVSGVPGAGTLECDLYSSDAGE